MKNDTFDTIYEKFIGKIDFPIRNHASFLQTLKDSILGNSYIFLIPIFKEINYFINSSLIEDYLRNDDKIRSKQIEIKDYFDEKKNLELNLKKNFQKY